MRRTLILAMIATALTASRQTALAQSALSLVATDALRVCADPGFLPYSNQQGEGFENRVADVIGRALHLPVAYTWYPQTAGFLRNTLLADKCDVVMGLGSGNGDAMTTPGYYHTAYMIVTRDADAITATSLADPALAGRRFGVVAGTPPSDLLVAHELMARTKVYPLLVDTRVDSPPLRMMRDVADGVIDVGLVWGPFAGWAITHQGLKLHAAMLQPEPGHPRLDYTVGLGVRFGDTAWANQLASAIRAHQPEIQTILASAGVPLLDSRNRAISLPAAPARPPG